MDFDPDDLVDPELRPLLALFPTRALDDTVLRDLRTRAPIFPEPDTPDVVTEERRVPGPPGAPDVRVLIWRPGSTAERRPGLLHIHGGGYVAGAPEEVAFRYKPLAADLGVVVVSVDYRLAPETPAPGAAEDCLAVLAWLAGPGAAELNVDPARIGVAGESAGGGLAAALTLLARDRGGPRLAFQHLTYPMLDDRTCLDPDPPGHVGRHIWTPHNNRWGWRAHLGREPGADDVSPYAAPARAVDLSGLPPAYISTGALDLFLSEDLEYARRLARAGVPLELHVYPGGFHGYDLAPAAVSARARAESQAALRRALHPAPVSPVTA